jgi:hypothetical protein
MKMQSHKSVNGHVSCPAFRRIKRVGCGAFVQLFASIFYHENDQTGSHLALAREARPLREERHTHATRLSSHHRLVGFGRVCASPWGDCGV